MHSVLRRVVASAAALTLLLAPAALVVAGDRATDPAGDGPPDGPDIIAVTTILTDNQEVRFEVEFASDFVRVRSFLYITIADPWTSTDVYCNGYVGPYVVGLPASRFVSSMGLRDDQAGLVVADPESSEGWSEAVPVPFTIAGPKVTITVPLSAIGDQQLLHFSVTAADLIGDAASEAGVIADYFPDSAHRDSGCHSVSLEAEPAVPPPSSPPSNGGPLMLVIAVVVLLAAGAVVATLRPWAGASARHAAGHQQPPQ